jgi:hypothetical protein
MADPLRECWLVGDFFGRGSVDTYSQRSDLGKPAGDRRKGRSHESLLLPRLTTSGEILCLNAQGVTVVRRAVTFVCRGDRPRCSRARRVRIEHKERGSSAVRALASRSHRDRGGRRSRRSGLMLHLS